MATLTTAEKLRRYFRKHPEARPVDAVAKFDCRSSQASTARQQVREELKNVATENDEPSPEGQNGEGASVAVASAAVASVSGILVGDLNQELAQYSPKQLVTIAVDNDGFAIIDPIAEAVTFKPRPR